MEKMRLAAERGADTVARTGQLAQKIAQAGQAASSALANGGAKYDSGRTIKKHNKHKNDHGKGKQQIGHGLGRKFHDKDGNQLKGKARKQAYNDSIKHAKKNGTFGKGGRKHN